MKYTFLLYIVLIMTMFGLIAGIIPHYAEPTQETRQQQGQSLTSETELRLDNIHAITPEGQFYIAPVWSPDEKYVLFSTDGYRGLYITQTDGNGSVRTLNEDHGVGYGAAWSANSTEVLYQSRGKDGATTHKEAMSFNLLSGLTLKRPNMRFNRLSNSPRALKDNDPVIYVNLETLLIEAQTLGGERTWVVTTNEGRFYSPVLSPDKTKVLVHEGSQMYIYAADGSGLLSSLGRGVGGSWSPDSKQILYFIDQDDGHQIFASELFIINTDGSNGKRRLTNTANFHEMWPSWSPSGTRVCFSEHYTGRIYIADLVRQ